MEQGIARQAGKAVGDSRQRTPLPGSHTKRKRQRPGVGWGGVRVGEEAKVGEWDTPFLLVPCWSPLVLLKYPSWGRDGLWTTEVYNAALSAVHIKRHITPPVSHFQKGLALLRQVF